MNDEALAMRYVSFSARGVWRAPTVCVGGRRRANIGNHVSPAHRRSFKLGDQLINPELVAFLIRPWLFPLHSEMYYLVLHHLVL